jgi:hypothetical protein
MRSGLLIALVLAAGCRDSTKDGEPVVRPPNYRASYAGSLDPEFPHGRELTISAGVELTDAKRRAIEAALGGALANAFPCLEGVFGTAPTEIEIDGAGTVVKAVVTSELLGGTKIAECIETGLRTM